MDARQRAHGLASRQYGAITRRQALDCGLSRNAIQWLVRSGLWIVYEPGTYLVAGQSTSWLQKAMAAVLAVGPRAVASHTTAASLHGLLADRLDPIHVTAPHGVHDGQGRSYVAHRSRAMRTRDVRRAKLIPVTSVTRTIVDLAGVVDPIRLESALDTALLTTAISTEAIRAYIEERGLTHVRGARRLRTLLADREGGVPESELEREFLRVVERFGVPTPERQRYSGPYRADFAYPDLRILIEVDGRRDHGTRAAFEEDRRRHNALLLQGWSLIMRFTWNDVRRDGAYVAHTVTEMIKRAG